MVVAINKGIKKRRANVRGVFDRRRNPPQQLSEL